MYSPGVVRLALPLPGRVQRLLDVQKLQGAPNLPDAQGDIQGEARPEQPGTETHALLLPAMGDHPQRLAAACGGRGSRRVLRGREFHQRGDGGDFLRRRVKHLARIIVVTLCSH